MTFFILRFVKKTIIRQPSSAGIGSPFFYRKHLVTSPDFDVFSIFKFYDAVEVK